MVHAVGWYKLNPALNAPGLSASNYNMVHYFKSFAFHFNLRPCNADHEQNASTSTVRIAGSSQANPFACIAAGVASLWGPAHGGANEAVLRMLEEIGTVGNIPACVARAKAGPGTHWESASSNAF